jgi:hypothetical protein
MRIGRHGNGCRCNRAEPVGTSAVVSTRRIRTKNCLHEVAGMDARARKCLERASEILRLAEAEEDPALKAYLVDLAASWTKAAGDNLVEPEDA